MPWGNRPKQTIEERFWTKVEKTYSCWNWLAYKNRHGYGMFRTQDRNRMILSHRFAYEMLVGPIPEKMTLDHLCRNRACVNPEHLEAVPSGINTLRGETVTATNAAKTHCPQGHPYDLVNTLFMRGGGRDCRVCGRIWHRTHYVSRSLRQH